MYKKSLVMCVVLMMLFACLAGNVFAQKYKFALVVHVAGTPFWTPVKKGADEAAKLLGISPQAVHKFLRTQGE